MKPQRKTNHEDLVALRPSAQWLGPAGYEKYGSYATRADAQRAASVFRDEYDATLAENPADTDGRFQVWMHP